MDSFPFPPTPPAHVAQLERRAEEQHTELRNLRSVVHANHLAVMHDLGQLAAEMLRVSQRLSAVAEQLAKLSQHMGAA